MDDGLAAVGGGVERLPIEDARFGELDGDAVQASARPVERSSITRTCSIRGSWVKRRQRLAR